LCGSRTTLEAAVPALARLRITVFGDWPYLYDGARPLAQHVETVTLV
jgi:hypothetical protein